MKPRGRQLRGSAYPASRVHFIRKRLNNATFTYPCNGQLQATFPSLVRHFYTGTITRPALHQCMLDKGFGLSNGKFKISLVWFPGSHRHSNRRANLDAHLSPLHQALIRSQVSSADHICYSNIREVLSLAPDPGFSVHDFNSSKIGRPWKLSVAPEG